MVGLLLAILALGPPEGPSWQDDQTLIQQTAAWVRDATSRRPELADSAREDLHSLDLDAVPGLAVHLGDLESRPVIVEAIETICDRALTELSRDGDEAVTLEERERMESSMLRAGPLAASSLMKAIHFGQTKERETAMNIWSHLKDSVVLDDSGWDQLMRTLPLSAPIVLDLARKEDTSARATLLMREASDLEIERLSSPDWGVRERAAEALFLLGDVAEPALGEAASSRDAHLAFTAGRLYQQIRWKVGTSLAHRLGHRLEGYEKLDWRDRRAMIYRIARLGRSEAIPPLRKILEVERSEAVRISAAESLAVLRDREGINYLKLLNLHSRFLTPRVTVGIYIDQGLRYLREDDYPEAEKEFLKALEIDPLNKLAHYNLACTYSLWGKTDEALRSLGLALENGFRKFRHMEKDEDLDPIRDDERYKELLDRFQSGSK
ncbi:MAG: tetratricopeptide repeat protein [Planctomycetota bacterium]|nr:tetratricopeptide repeat protein [Planctomycetota bacterium]